jgi:hypothetical protein
MPPNVRVVDGQGGLECLDTVKKHQDDQWRTVFSEIARVSIIIDDEKLDS